MTAPRLTLDPQAPDPAAIERAARILREGGIVAFPTETVYGLAANADDPVALERMRRAKGRAPQKPFTIHLSDPAQAPLHAARIPWRARRLMARYWPGPLTLLLPGRRAPVIGLRMPAGRIPQEMIRRSGVPVAATSANRTGEPPPAHADPVAATLGGDVDLILDGGPCGLGEASTVARLTGPRLEVLREGILTCAMLETTASIGILFVCTGNTCRSPMAQGMFRLRIAERLGAAPADLPAWGFRCASAGLGGGGAPASSPAVRTMAARGIDLGSHRSRTVTPRELRAQDLVFGMTDLHVDRCREMAPDVADRMMLLAPDGAQIHDPAWGTDEEYERCARQIDDAARARVDGLLERLAQEEEPGGGGVESGRGGARGEP